MRAVCGEERPNMQHQQKPRSRQQSARAMTPCEVQMPIGCAQLQHCAGAAQTAYIPKTAPAYSSRLPPSDLCACAGSTTETRHVDAPRVVPDVHRVCLYGRASIGARCALPAPEQMRPGGADALPNSLSQSPPGPQYSYLVLSAKAKEQISSSTARRHCAREAVWPPDLLCRGRFPHLRSICSAARAVGFPESSCESQILTWS